MLFPRELSQNISFHFLYNILYFIALRLSRYPEKLCVVSRKTFALTCKMFECPKEKLHSLAKRAGLLTKKFSLSAKHLRSHAKRLRAPKKICTWLQNVCIHLRN